MKQLAISGGEKLRKSSFPSWPIFNESEMENVKKVLGSRVWGAGPRGNASSSRVAEFGEKFARYHGVKYGLPVNNGTVSLEIALKAGKIGWGDEVVVPAYTFFATASSILRVNAIPVFADVNPATYCIDPECIQEVITPKTRAIVPVHIAGEFADMDRIMEIAEKNGLFVLEDAAHAIGAVWRDKRAGSIGHAGSFSFQSAKTMTSGEGGAIITDSPEIYEDCVQNVAFGRRANRPVFEHYLPAGNQRLSEFQAAILLSQLERLDSQISLREENAQYLTKRLSKIAGIKPQKRDARTKIKGYFWYMMEYIPESFNGVSRDRFLQALNAEGIPCSGGYTVAIPKNPVFQDVKFYLAECPWVQEALDRIPNLLDPPCNNAIRIANQGIALPQQVLLGNHGDMDDIVSAIEKVKTYIAELK
jgi:dTDP-4-amino-4,6-dideoxygalactose transaminase